MFEWLVGIGIVLVLMLLLKLLDHFDLYDIFDLFGDIARLATGAIALLASLLLWSARKVSGAGKTAKPAPDEQVPAPRGSIRGRTFARPARLVSGRLARQGSDKR